MKTGSRSAKRRATRLRGWLVPLAVHAVSGCELAEIVTPAGEDLLVVEAVLRAGDTRQEVLLHRTLAGGVVRGERQARVVIRDPEGREVVLGERPLDSCTGTFAAEQADSLEVEATCYSTRSGELSVRPGASYGLRVETLRGEVVRGQTRVPGDFDVQGPRLSRNGRACTLPPATRLEVVWSSASGAWSYLAAVQISGLRSALAGSGIQAPDPLELTGLAISESDTTIVLPSELGVFQRFGANQELLRLLQSGFPAGVSVDMVVSAVDRNYVNGVRGGSFNPSGTVRVSSVAGDGIGVFGSLVARRLFVWVSPTPGALPTCTSG